MTIKVKLIEQSGHVHNIRVSENPTRETTTVVLAQPIVDPVVSTSCYLEFIQNFAQTTWLIPHNFGKYPTVSVHDTDHELVKANIHHLDLNVTQITFTYPFSGSAILTA